MISPTLERGAIKIEKLSYDDASFCRLAAPEFGDPAALKEVKQEPGPREVGPGAQPERGQLIFTVTPNYSKRRTASGNFQNRIAKCSDQECFARLNPMIPEGPAFW
jgi:hypothetical protein